MTTKLFILGMAIVILGIALTASLEYFFAQPTAPKDRAMREIRKEFRRTYYGTKTLRRYRQEMLKDENLARGITRLLELRARYLERSYRDFARRTLGVAKTYLPEEDQLKLHSDVSICERDFERVIAPAAVLFSDKFRGKHYLDFLPER
ncbi:MAG: hypothetical protein AAB495_00800 [Patescibacteria group bacterium]